MPACVLTPLFVKAAQRIHDIDPATVHTVVDGFLGGIPMATLSARTGVPNDALNRMFTLAWREALTYSEILPGCEAVHQSEPALDPTTLQSVAELAKCCLPKNTIREYLKLKPAVFEAHWKAAMECRRSTGQPPAMAASAS